MAGRELKVTIVGDASKLSRSFKDASKSSNVFGKSMAKTAKLATLGLGALAGGAMFAGKRMIEMASDAGEVQSKMEVVFGKQLPQLTKNIDQFSKATGTSRFEMREQAADMGALLEPLVGSKKAAADMSFQFTKLATDLGSFNNVPTADALLAIRSGLVGEAEPLRRFGVLLNEAAVSAEGLRLGLIKKGQTMTEQDKVQARASLIMQQTALAQGDATRTAGSMANQMKALRAAVSDTATEIGMKLIPFALKVVTAFNTHWPTIKRVAETVFTAIGTAITTLRGVFDRNWAQMKAAGQSVMTWYKANLEPTIVSVSRNIARAWDAAMSDMKSDANGKMGATAKSIRLFSQSIVAAVNSVLAVLRGDWPTAWEMAKKAVMSSVRGILAIMSGFQQTVAAAASAIGRAIVDGILSGASGLASRLFEKLSSGIRGAMDAVKSKFKIFSPSKVFATEIGMPLGLGILAGFESGAAALGTVMQKKIQASLALVTGLQRQLDAINARREAQDRAMAVREAEAALAQARKKKEGVAAAELALARAREDIIVAGLTKALVKEQAAYDKRLAMMERFRERATAALDVVSEKLLRVFDAQTGGHTTAAGGAIDAINQRRQQEDLAQAVVDAQARVTEALKGGDPAEIAAAQRTLFRAQEDVQLVSLEAQKADQEKAYADQREAQRVAFEARLKQMSAAFAREGTTVKKAMSKINALMREFGITFAETGQLVGEHFVKGLMGAIAGAGAAAAGVPGGGASGGSRKAQQQVPVVQVVLDGRVLAESARNQNVLYNSRGGSLAVM